MSVQVRRRREAASFLASFVGAQGELLVDTTNNRVQVHDGVTPGGWPAAKLADVAQRTTVSDASYTALATDRTVAFSALTAARTVTLPAAAAFPTGTRLLVVDESGAASATVTITLAAAGSDTINGATVALITVPYGLLALQGNASGRWTIVDRAINKAPTQTLLTVASGNAGSGTYTSPVGASWLRVRMIGGGGGGGGSGGSPGAGSAGGASSFGPLTVAGGTAATGQTAGSGAATPTTGDLNITGNGGVDGMTGVAGLSFTGGIGGASTFAGGGRSLVNGVGGGGKSNTGTGGGGAGASGATSSGGGGSAGAFLEKIIASPAATYAFTVGAAGAGGAAGSGGFNGGSGAAGLILVEEHFD